MWNGLIDWMESEPLKKHLIDKSEKIVAKANQTIITMISCLQQVIALLVAAQETIQ